MRLLLSMLLFSTASVAPAQQVYKCASASGSVIAYQSQPCDRSHRTLRQWEAAPDPVPAAARVAAAADRPASQDARTAKQRKPRAGNAGARPRVDPADARCHAAKARREAKLKAVGLKRTFDLLRQLDDAVHEACR